MKIKIPVLLCLVCLMACILESANCCPKTVPLWPEGIPNATVVEDRQEVTIRQNGDKHLSKVTLPEMTIYKPSCGQPTPAVVICPGGGYGILAYIKEGTEIGEFLASKGITGIVLKYRLPSKDFQDDPSIAPLQDAQRAIQLARQHANDWNIDPNAIGVMGFSAGGHLASTVAHQWKEPVIANASPADVRPDFSILVYPVISFIDEELTHKGSRRNLLGDEPDEALYRKFSAELQVDEKTPPVFLVHAFDDGSVPVGNSVNYAMALHAAGIACEAHLYQIGGHGFGMRTGHADDWPYAMVKWIRLNFIL